ncbi:MAG: type II toxin-antitoxin system RelE/ParE family toxin [Leptolyngbyaceae bacterium]|nr:type II toxin-antitoxin system RelE/ParE family toxin [Leptolyngbyaceae bacterium]
MNVNYLPSFIRDLKTLKKSPIYSTLHSLVFQELPNYSSIEQIPNLKRLRGDDQAYRIRVGDYRIGVFVDGDTMTLARVKHRRDIYRYFP